jgi:hypothetical protein
MTLSGYPGDRDFVTAAPVLPLPRNGNGAVEARSRAHVGPAASGADVFLIAVMGMILTYVWRLQLLWFGNLLDFRLALVSTIIAVPAWLLATDPARRLRQSLKFSTTRLVLALGALVAISTPLAMFPGRSFNFVRWDYATTLLFFVLSAAAARSFRDVERLALTYVIGGAIFSLIVLSRFQVNASGRVRNLPSYDAND